MKQKENAGTSPAGAGGLGDISMIRDILMGQQINEFDKKFNELDSSLNTIENALNEKIRLLKQQNEQRFDALEKEVHERFDLLEKLVRENTQMLMETIKQSSKNDKHSIGKLFSEMSQKLMQ